MKKRKSTIWGMVMIAMLLGTVFLTGCFDDDDKKPRVSLTNYDTESMGNGVVNVTFDLTNHGDADAEVTYKISFNDKILTTDSRIVPKGFTTAVEEEVYAGYEAGTTTTEITDVRWL